MITTSGNYHRVASEQQIAPRQRRSLGYALTIAALAAASTLSTPAPSQAAVIYDKEPSGDMQTTLPLSKWQESKKKPRGVVLMLHGLTQRAFTLRAMAKKLASDGFIIYGLDLRGHGWWRKTMDNGDAGYIANYSQSVDDAREVLEVIKNNNPDLPLFVMGESVGAAVALRAAAESPEGLSGLILCGAGSKACHAKTTWFIADLLKSLIRKPIGLIRYQKEYGTDDLIALEETLKDPMQRKNMSLRELWRARGILRKNKKYAKELNPQISLLMIHGAEDETLKLKSARKVFEEAPSVDKKMVVVPDCGHILLGTSRPKELVSNSIEKFLTNRVSTRVADSGKRMDSSHTLQ